MPQASTGLSPTQVAIVTSRLDVGGTERHLVRVLPELKRKGIDVILYLMERGGVLENGLVEQGVRVEGPHRVWPNFLRWPAATVRLALWLRRERPGLVHFFLPRPYLYGSIAAELAGHRRRIMSRRSLANYMQRHPLASRLERLMHRRTAGLIGNSMAVVAQLEAEVSDHQKLALIHNGVEVPPPMAKTERERMRRDLGIDHDTLVIVIVANLLHYKGHQDLFEALSLVKEQLPTPWLLLAIGRDGGIAAQLADVARALGIDGNVKWLGEQPVIERLLNCCDIFVLPSHQEGFSNALLEAMAAGLPAIATAVGGNVDAVIDGESGLLVNPKDPAGLAAAILRLAKDELLRRRLAAAARDRVHRHFSLESCIERYETLYNAMNEPIPKRVSEILSPAPSAALKGKLDAPT
jgi:glycosyltransferase involved in cell wall biosynthesis